MSKREPKTEWQRIEPLRCDLCPALAVWAHPLGGRRCARCPRPEAHVAHEDCECEDWIEDGHLQVCPMRRR